MNAIKKPAPRAVLASNLRHLMTSNGHSEPALARLSGVSQKTINNILNHRTSVTLDNIELIAQVYGLYGWHLIMPNLPDDLITSPSLDQLYRSYAAASDEGRRHINMVADREAQFTEQKKAP
jgi:transcriptional regulator with XRE-family HTH domain